MAVYKVAACEESVKSVAYKILFQDVVVKSLKQAYFLEKFIIYIRVAKVESVLNPCSVLERGALDIQHIINQPIKLHKYYKNSITVKVKTAAPSE